MSKEANLKKIVKEHSLQNQLEKEEKDALEDLERLNDPALRKKAKLAYLKGEGLNALSNKWNIPRSVIRQWAKGEKGEITWQEQREIIYQEQLEDSLATRKEILAEIGGLSLHMIRDALKARYDKRDGEKRKPLSLPEAALVTKILTDFDKIQRLDEGKPTSISEHQEVTLTDLKSAMDKDLFLDLVPLNSDSKRYGLQDENKNTE